MKKTVLILLLVALAVCSLSVLSACKNDEELHIEDIEITVVKNAVFTVGDTFDSAKSKFTITAKLSDGTEQTITNTSSLRYFQDGLNIVDGKFSEPGEHTMTIRFLYYKWDRTVTFTVNP